MLAVVLQRALRRCSAAARYWALLAAMLVMVAVLVTLVLWLPDLWILAHGEPIRGVGVLMLMHLAIALITYPALVHLAPVNSPGRRSVLASQRE